MLHYAPMILSRRVRSVFLGLGFYALAGAAVGYFAWHAHHGERGLHAKVGYKIRAAQLELEIKALRDEKAQWERRVGLMRADSIDRDILEEQSRILLNVAHRNDVIVVLPAPR
jgi:cell division protein FtsB